MKLLSGSELAGFIKERQAKAVRGLRQAHRISPKLAVVLTVDNPIINIYMRLKKQYGADILVDVDIHRIKQADAPALIKKLNQDKSVHGIIVQLPLEDPTQTEELVNLVDPAKDVDALGQNVTFDPATPTAILWLLSGYNIDLQGKNVLLIGQGTLVGRPLKKMLEESGIEPVIADENTEDIAALSREADVIVTATGQPGVLTTNIIKPGAVVVDAGTASESGKIVGDLAPDVYERDDLTLTPQKGGVGPLTICALFENLITAARGKIKS